MGSIFQFYFLAGASQVKWNRHDENFLASSHDGDVRVWDRKARKDSMWIFINVYFLQRAGTAVTYIAAHTLKTHGLDWSRQDRNILASASQDSTVKVSTFFSNCFFLFFGDFLQLWDVKSPRTAKCVLSVGMPVWRAKFTVGLFLIANAPYLIIFLAIWVWRCYAEGATVETRRARGAASMESRR